MFSLPVCWAHRPRFSLNQSRLQLSLLRSRYMSSRLAPEMDNYGFPATGPMETTATSGFMATGLWHLSRGYSGLRVIGAMQAAPTSGMAVIGVPASDTTAGSTMASAIMDRASTVAVGKAAPFIIIPQFGKWILRSSATPTLTEQ